MFRKYVITTLAAGFLVGSLACTSKKAGDENADLEAGLEGESLEMSEATENFDDLSVEGGGEGGESGGGGEEAFADLGDELAPAEQLPEEGGGDMVADSGDLQEVTPSDLSETPPAEDIAA
ncbi:MAG: hypothetical protein AB7P49_13330, partial [Bdellovibrionales bacterium]